MRHRKRNAKLSRKGEHRNAMLANLVCSLILHRRITTTLAKAKAARPVAEKMVTLAKKGALHHRRLAASRLRQEDAARVLFHEIAPVHQNRNGGYTRIIRLHQRTGDAAPMAILEWVEEQVESTVSTPAKDAVEKPEKTETAETAETPAAEAEDVAEAPKDEAPAAEAEETSKEASKADGADVGEKPTDEEKKDG